MTRSHHDQPTKQAPPPLPEPANRLSGNTAAAPGTTARTQQDPNTAKRSMPTRARRTRRGTTRATISGAIGGFFLGVAFWHTVGFWSFISHAVFNGPRTQTASLDTQSAPTPAATRQPKTRIPAQPITSGPGPIETGSITMGSITTGSVDSGMPARKAPHTKAAATISGRYPAPPIAATDTCSTLVLDRRTGATIAQMCPPSRKVLAEVPAHAREDRLPPRQQTGWSTAVELETEPEEPWTAAQQ